jgi:hypothetical protein
MEPAGVYGYSVHGFLKGIDSQMDQNPLFLEHDTKPHSSPIDVTRPTVLLSESLVDSFNSSTDDMHLIGGLCRH